jgi:hypothetical protein
MLKITMRKSPVAAKRPRVRTGSREASVVEEHEQLYLVKKSGNLSLGFLDQKP